MLSSKDILKSTVGPSSTASVEVLIVAENRSDFCLCVSLAILIDVTVV